MAIRQYISIFAGLFLAFQCAALSADDMNQKVARLNMSKGGLEDVISIFGQPQKYIWDQKTFTKDNLPDVYFIQYDNGFSAFVRQGKIVELRFEEKDNGFRFEGKLGIGSTLEQAVKVLGKPEQTVENQKNDFADKVLYKDIDGQKGRCYYQRSDKNVRVFFMGDKIIALYIANPTRFQGREEQGGSAIKIIDINQKVAKLNMSKGGIDDVISIFGQPQRYIWEQKTFTKDNLPDVYIVQYDNGFSVVVTNKKIAEFRFEGQDKGYRFEGKLKIGSTLQEALDILGQPERTMEGQKFEPANRVLYKDIDGQKGHCCYPCSDKNICLFFLDYKVNAIYITASVGSQGGGGKKRDDRIEAADSVGPYTDVRDKDLQKALKPSDRVVIRTLTFNQNTVWPEFPVGKWSVKEYINDLVEKAKNPGLGVRQLHQQGITGKGVSVAIIDQVLAGLNHPEYDGKIVIYQDFTKVKEGWSMHGPAVASLLVGRQCGTAPGADLYYAAVPSGNIAKVEAEALDWLVEKNRQLPKDKKIRVVSVSAAPGAHDNDGPLWDQACQRAEAEGVMVLDCTERHGFIFACHFRSPNVEGPAGCEIGPPDSRWQRNVPEDHIFVPNCPRTTAEQKSQEQAEYIYWGKAGLSWSIPYCAGVLAMGWQVKPDATPEQMKELLLKTAYQTKDKAKIINPPRFIQALQKGG